MDSILQNLTFFPPRTLAEEGQRRRGASHWGVLVVAALNWTALAVAVLAFVVAGIVLRLG